MAAATTLSHRKPPVTPSGRSGAGPNDSRQAVWKLLLGRDLRAGNLPISNESGHEILREGVSGSVLDPLAELLEIGPTQLAPVVGVDRATARRYAQGDRQLPIHSAETVLRLAELEAIALGVFASEQAAHGWLKARHPLLGESPIDACSTSYGAQRVREILAAIKFGGVA